ncbi:MAG: cobalamin-dependent protein, partial [Anaerolineales bacterium]
PVRTEGGHRLYSARDIEMIRWFMARQEEGMRISQAVQMWKDICAEGVDPINPARRSVDVQLVLEGLSEDSALVRLREAWIESTAQFDEFAAEQILAQAFARYPVELVVVEVLQKGLSQIGEAWYQGTFTVQQEHFASSLALRRLNALISAAPAPTRNEKILVACPPDEWHVFAPLMATLILRYHGWAVTYLGANVPLEDLEKTIQQVKPDLIIYVSTQLNTADSLLDIGRVLEEKDIPMAFGGRIFSQHDELHTKVPGYYLGNQLQDIAASVEKIFLGAIEANSAVQIPGKYKQALESFDQVEQDMNAALINRYAGTELEPELLRMINRHMAEYIRAGLNFGDISLVSPEIAWARTMISNNAIAQNHMNDYLGDYVRFLEENLDQEGNVIIDWLKMQ